jgi:hypothetical protein
MLARVLWIQGFAKGALNDARHGLEEPDGTDHQCELYRTARLVRGAVLQASIIAEERFIFPQQSDGRARISSVPSKYKARES